jgi:type I restriction enzyme R subunit
MKGRGTRTISTTDFNAVTPDAPAKTHFVIVDAVGVCENDKTDSRPLERKRSVPFDKLINSVALGIRDEDTVTSLAGRLAALDREIDDKDRQEIKNAAGGKSLKELINGLLDATDPDRQAEKAQAMFGTGKPTNEQVEEATYELVNAACTPFDNSTLRNTVVEIKQRNEQVIDIVSKDEVLVATWDSKAKEKARAVIGSFKKFIEENRDQITALQLIYGQRYGKRHLTYNEIRELAEAIRKPPYGLNPEAVWQAYEQLEQAKVKGAGPQKLLTNIISLVRFAIGVDNSLEPFPDIVDRRFVDWLAQQQRAGRKFTKEQLDWLVMIKEHIATSASIGIGDFELTPFQEKGGAVKASKVFDQQLVQLLEELNGVLVA